MSQVDLSAQDRRLLRETICARHALEVWRGDGTLSEPAASARLEELYRELGGTFDEMTACAARLALPRKRFADGRVR